MLEDIMPIPESGCWIWMGGTTAKGYGRVALGNGRGQTAHRFFYEKHKGEIPAGMCVCHTCDTPICVNPDHLFLGTHQENMADKTRKGRAAKKLNPLQVLKIRNDPRSQHKIARAFNISQRTVGRIKRGEFWAHLQEKDFRVNC